VATGGALGTGVVVSLGFTPQVQCAEFDGALAAGNAAARSRVGSRVLLDGINTRSHRERGETHVEDLAISRTLNNKE
jgi:hypothetical protein